MPITCSRKHPAIMTRLLNPPAGRGINYVLQFLVVLAVLGALWFLDPFGWHRAAAPVATRDTTVYSTLTQIENLQSRLSQDSNNSRLQADLATLYLQYVRESGDPSYYNKADALLHQVLATDPKDLSALVQMGNLSLARHDFQAALQWGKQATAVDDHHWLAYGIIGDAHVELGQYDDAQAAFDKMVTLRPDINSYSRISYMRELLGDMNGAIQAMTLATRAGLPNSEPSNWARVQLGNLYFNTGKLDQAELLYKTSLELYPAYIHALAGMGRVRAARGDFNGAISFYNQALRQIPIPEYVIALGDVYAASGNPAEAQKQYALVGAIRQLYTANGVDTDLEIALFNADHGITPADTVAQARSAYARRPSIFAADVVAWTLYQNGEYQEADKFSRQALRLGTQDALKFFHAGMIAFKLGDTAQARDYLSRALALNPNFSLHYAPLAKQTLQQLP